MRSLTIVAALALSAAPLAHAGTTFSATLLPEVSDASGSGFVTVVYDALLQTLAIDASFSGLSGITTVAHIHCCVATAGTGTVGVAVTPGTLPGFPVGASSGSYASLPLDLTQSATYTANFVAASGGSAAAAEAALVAGLGAGTAYFNIHTDTFPGGEIRGFLAPVPEPSTYALMALGLLAVGGLARQRARC